MRLKRELTLGLTSKSYPHHALPQVCPEHVYVGSAVPSPGRPPEHESSHSGTFEISRLGLGDCFAMRLGSKWGLEWCATRSWSDLAWHNEQTQTSGGALRLPAGMGSSSPVFCRFNLPCPPPHVVESNRVALGLRARVEGRWLAPWLGHSGSQNSCGLRRGASRTITTIPRTSLEKTMRESMICVGTRTFGPRPSAQERIGTIGIESTRIGATGMNDHLGPRPSAQRRIVATGMASTRIGATDMRGHANPGRNEESVQPSSARSDAAGMRGHATTRALSTGGSIGLGAPPADARRPDAQRSTTNDCAQHRTPDRHHPRQGPHSQRLALVATLTPGAPSIALPSYTARIGHIGGGGGGEGSTERLRPTKAWYVI